MTHTGLLLHPGCKPWSTLYVHAPLKEADASFPKGGTSDNYLVFEELVEIVVVVFIFVFINVALFFRGINETVGVRLKRGVINLIVTGQTKLGLVPYQHKQNPNITENCSVPTRAFIRGPCRTMNAIDWYIL